MKILLETANKNTVLSDAGEGNVFGNFLGAVHGDKLSAARYMVVYHPVCNGVRVERSQKFDTYIDALMFFSFQKKHENFIAAKEAGLDDATAELIAQGKLTLEAALGDMDMDAETFYMEDSYLMGCEDDPEDDGFDADLHGGEDDNTPSLEVIMAGGQAAWEYQNEKNAWLDNRFC